MCIEKRLHWKKLSAIEVKTTAYEMWIVINLESDAPEPQKSEVLRRSSSLNQLEHLIVFRNTVKVYQEAYDNISRFKVSLLQSPGKFLQATIFETSSANPPKGPQTCFRAYLIKQIVIQACVFFCVPLKFKNLSL